MTTPRAIVQFSGGAQSYVAGVLAAEEFGPENTLWLFADTLTEDADLYRFIGDVERRMNCQVIRVCEGRTPWQVFHDEGMIGNTRADLCSRILKREPLAAWLRENSDPEIDTIIIGYDFTEGHRADGPRGRLKPWRVRYPLVEQCVFPDRARAIVQEHGIALPRLYGQGFAHNNCGGACVKAGQAVWALLLDRNPALFAEHESEEERFRTNTGKDVSILRDRTGGATTPLTLRQLRERHQREPSLIDWNDYGACSCMEPVT